ncbi:MAG: methionine--tRNA ligase [Alphaproteobacteria bacterium]|nr:methionine--tRNA ligase [Alphaproteobacteria bacterium]
MKNNNSISNFKDAPSKSKKILTTSALPYVNGLQHLGHLAGNNLPTDLYSRFLRQKGYEVLSVCGADMHGAAIEIGAEKEGLSVLDYSEKYFKKIISVYKKFNISYDIFGKTSIKENFELTQEIAKRLLENGFLVEKTIEMFFSKVDNRFLMDRLIEGVCPFCDFSNARGDQCDKCGELLTPQELKNPFSKISGDKNLELKKTRHLFLQLGKLKPKLEEWLANKRWDNTTAGIVKKWMKVELKDRCITRDLEWGVPVPFPNFENKVFYVWFDAPIAYLAMTKKLCLDRNIDPNEWIKDNNSTMWTQFMGKDNIVFHSIIFPAILLGADQNWKLVDTIKGLNFLNFEGEKFSKSNNVGIYLEDAIKLYQSDMLRYYLIINSPETDDFNFKVELFKDTINKDLNNTLGNFVSRVTKFTAKYFDDNVPVPCQFTQEDVSFFDNIQSILDDYHRNMFSLNIKKSAENVRSLWIQGNKFITDNEPWKIVKNDRERTATILFICFQLIDLFRRTMKPIIPDTADKLSKMTPDLKLDDVIPDRFDIAVLPKGEKFSTSSSMT